MLSGVRFAVSERSASWSTSTTNRAATPVLGEGHEVHVAGQALFLRVLDKGDVAPGGARELLGVVVRVAGELVAVCRELIPLLAGHLAGLAPDADGGRQETEPHRQVNVRARPDPRLFLCAFDSLRFVHRISDPRQPPPDSHPARKDAIASKFTIPRALKSLRCMLPSFPRIVSRSSELRRHHRTACGSRYRSFSS